MSASTPDRVRGRCAGDDTADATQNRVRVRAVDDPLTAVNDALRINVDNMTCVACATGSVRVAGDNPLNDRRPCGWNGRCVACAGGSIRDAGDDPLTAGETACGCAADQRVDANGDCVACAGNSIRDAGDDPLTSGETACGCAANQRVDANGDCVACTGGSTRDAGDDPLTSGETACACALDERVAANACVACPVGETRAAGDDPLGVDTFCAAVMRVELLVVNDKRRCDAFAKAEDSEATYESLSSIQKSAAVAAMRLHTAATVASAASIFADATVFSPPLRLVLVGQMDWCEGDAIDVPQASTRESYPDAETEADALLEAFGAWRDRNATAAAFGADVAHLFTGRDLDGQVTHAATAFSMCADDRAFCGSVFDPARFDGVPKPTLGPGECADDPITGARKCCYANKAGAVASVADPSSTATLGVDVDALALAAESGVVVARAVGLQLGFAVDGDALGAASTCPDAGFVMSPLNAAANRRPTAPGGFSACSAATFATQASDPRALECLRHGAASACGNGVVEPEYGEECDCGGSSGGDACERRYGSHRDDPHCDASTCLFKASAATEAPPPPLLSPPPLTYEPHAWCDSACGVAREKGASPFVTDVPPDKCLRCAAGTSRRIAV